MTTWTNQRSRKRTTQSTCYKSPPQSRSASNHLRPIEELDESALFRNSTPVFNEADMTMMLGWNNFDTAFDSLPLPDSANDFLSEVFVNNTAADNCESVDTIDLNIVPDNKTEISSLPPLIRGVDTAFEHRLFKHFITSVGPNLVLRKKLTEDTFTQTIVDFALCDLGVMKTLFSISASHLAQAIQANSPVDVQEPAIIRQAGMTYYSDAVEVQNQMSSKLSDSLTEASQANTVSAFVAAMLLTQYETCEGGRNGVWRTHLATAKQILQQHRRSWARRGLRDLFDWFAFHDTLSRLSESAARPMFPDRLLGEEAIPGVDEVEQPAEFVLIGPRDGLFEVLHRIIDLQCLAQQQASVPGAKLSILLEGLQISSELRLWICPYVAEQSRIVAECFRWAAFLMLYATVHQVSICDDEIQVTLNKGLEWLDQLSATENEQTCSLCPIFTFGVAALAEEHRDLVAMKLNAYWSWSALGNVTATLDFLRQWWTQVDEHNGKVKWWDWQEFAAHRGITVTLV